MEYNEIQEKVKKIINEPIRKISDSEMAKIRKIIENKCPTSILWAERAKKAMPGGTQHGLLITDPFPIVIDRTLGSKMWDIDGNEYIDYLCASGPLILGHNYAPLRDEVIEVVKQTGQVHGWFSKWEVKAIEQIKKYYPSIDLFRFYSSGTEACMAAIRIARVYTNKKKIIRIGGTYHGWSDQLTYDMHVPYLGALESDGIPKGCYKDTVAIPPNDFQQLEIAFKKNENKGGTAAIIIEPLGPDTGHIPLIPEYNKVVRELCDRYDSLLIFDEVITGFRLDLGGAQKYFNIKPDLTTMGKCLTYGYPSSGGVGGREDIMMCLVAGLEIGKKRAYSAGTLTANPLSTSATYWFLNFMEKENAIARTAQSGDKFTRELNNLFNRLNLPFFAYNYRSILHFHFYCAGFLDIRSVENIEKALDRDDGRKRLNIAFLSEGIITKEGEKGFTNIAHSDEDIDHTMKAFENVLKKIKVK